MWRIAMKPGRPLAFGKRGAARSFIGLAGQPGIELRHLPASSCARSSCARRASTQSRRTRIAARADFDWPRARRAARVPARKMERAAAGSISIRRRTRRCSPRPRGPTAWSTIPPGRRSARATWCSSCRIRSCTGEDQTPFLRRRCASRLGSRGEELDVPPDVDHGGRRCARSCSARGGAWQSALAPEQGGAQRGEPGHGGRPTAPRQARATKWRSFPPVTGG